MNQCVDVSTEKIKIASGEASAPEALCAKPVRSYRSRCIAFTLRPKVSISYNGRSYAIHYSY